MDLSQLVSQNSPQLNGVLKGSSSGGLRSTLKLAKSLSLSSKPNDPKDDGTRALFGLTSCGKSKVVSCYLKYLQMPLQN